MTPPQRLGYVTLGARSMRALRTFYAGLGWIERPGSNDEFATYEMGSTLLALYPLGLLSKEAAPGEGLPDSSWSGVTLGINVDRNHLGAQRVAALVWNGLSRARRRVRGEGGPFAAVACERVVGKLAD